MNKKNKQNRLITMALLLISTILVFSACANNPTDDTATDSQNNTTELDTTASDSELSGLVEPFYNSLKKQLLDSGDYTEDNIRIQNLPKLTEMNKLAYEYSTPSFYVEIDISTQNGSGMVKRYVDNGSLREEEYADGELAYINIYNAIEDVYYFYNAEENDLIHVTEASKKNRAPVQITLGCFEFSGNNAWNYDLKEADYNGKPAIVSKSTDPDFINEVWYDKETGTLLYYLQEMPSDGFKYEMTYHLIPAMTFDSIIFTFDENKLTADEMVG